jgi:hypothetical protein
MRKQRPVPRGPSPKKRLSAQQRCDGLQELADAQAQRLVQLSNRVSTLEGRMSGLRQRLDAIDGYEEQSKWFNDQRVRAKTLRQCAEEIEGSLRSGSVPPDEILRNCVAWYRAQANNMDPRRG